MPIDISQAGATYFCTSLRKAVQGDSKLLVSRLVALYPIEMERDGKDLLIRDDNDFVDKFDLVFDSDLRSALFALNGCQLKNYPDSTSRIAEGQVIIAQVKGDREPLIEAISPPRDVSVLEPTPDRKYEEGADAFFDAFKRAVADDNRQAVTSLCSYPLRVVIDGKDKRMENRQELLKHYAQVFTPELKTNILARHMPIHMGWRGFMTDRGALWLDQIVWTHVYRVVGINGLQWLRGNQ